MMGNAGNALQNQKLQVYHISQPWPNFFSKEWWKITCGGNPRTFCVSLKSEQGQIFLGVICFWRGSKEQQLLPVQSLTLVPVLHKVLLCYLLPIWPQSFWKEEANWHCLILFLFVHKYHMDWNSACWRGVWQCVKGKGQGTVHLRIYLYSSYAVIA